MNSPFFQSISNSFERGARDQGDGSLAPLLCLLRDRGGDRGDGSLVPFAMPVGGPENRPRGTPVKVRRGTPKGNRRTVPAACPERGPENRPRGSWKEPENRPRGASPGAPKRTGENRPYWFKEPERIICRYTPGRAWSGRRRAPCHPRRHRHPPARCAVCLPARDWLSDSVCLPARNWLKNRPNRLCGS